MLTLIRSGTGLYHHKAAAQGVRAGFVGIVLPSADPGLLIAETEDPYDHYYCRFAGDEALRMARAASAAHGGAAFFEYPRWPEAMIVFESMLTLESRGGASASQWMTQTEAELARLLALLVSVPPSTESRLGEASLRQYMIDRISEPFDLDQMAQSFGMSRFSFSRRARAILGESLSSASRRLKLEFSRALLGEPALDLTIAEIALRAGYQDALYFSRVFSRQFSLSPSAYRGRVRAPKGNAR